MEANWLLQQDRQLLDEVLEPEMARQYRLSRGEQCRYVPLLLKDRWLCSCGCENRGRETCGCGLPPEALSREVLQQLRQEAEPRLAREEEERLQQQAREAQAAAQKQKKARWRTLRRAALWLTAAVALLALAVGIWQLCVHIFIPMYHYNRGKEALAQADYAQAYGQLKQAGDWQDAPALLERFAVLPLTESTQSAEEQKLWEYTYDAQGRQILARCTTSLADGAGGYITVDAPLELVDTYDAQGRPVRQSDVGGYTLYTYDEHGGVKNEYRYELQNTPRYERTYNSDYDAEGRLLRRELVCSDFITPSYSYEQQVTYRYNSRGLVELQTVRANYPGSVDSGYTAQSRWEYDDLGQPVSCVTETVNIVDVNDVCLETEQWEYDEAGRVSRYRSDRAYAPDESLNCREEALYTYDGWGHMTSEERWLHYPNDKVRDHYEYQRFVYDDRGRILEEHLGLKAEDALRDRASGYTARGQYVYEGELLTEYRWTRCSGGEQTPESTRRTVYRYEGSRLTEQVTVTENGSFQRQERLEYYDDGQLRRHTSQSDQGRTVTEYTYLYTYK